MWYFIGYFDLWKFILITTIENFTLKFESQSISSIDSFKGERPDYASPSLKSTDFKGKILFERSL